MHRLLFVPVTMALACTRDNTGFILVDDDPATASTGGASTDDPPTSTGPTATTEEATTGEATTEPPRLCEPPEFELGLDLVAKIDDVVIEPPPGCEPQVFTGIGTFSAAALEVVLDADTDFPGKTLRVETSFFNDVNWGIPNQFMVQLAWSEDCNSLRSTVIWNMFGNIPVLVIVGVSGSPEPPAGAEFLAPTVEPTLDGDCDCEGSITDCCQYDTLHPGTYQLRFEDVASTVLQEGESLVEAATFGNQHFYLVNMRSHAHASCDDPAAVHLDWYAVRGL